MGNGCIKPGGNTFSDLFFQKTEHSLTYYLTYLCNHFQYNKSLTFLVFIVIPKYPPLQYHDTLK